jgi:putative CocE/NonD family hydrolase
MFGDYSSVWRADAAGPLPIRLERHLAVPMRDGVKLYGDLYRPRAEGKYPVLIVRTPYGVQRDGVHETMMKFAQNGYAVFIQDTRGRYESEGKWEPFRTEAEDGYDTIEWAAKQSWSNGRVATQGGSYLGHVQWRAGSLTPPSLVAMFPAVASTNIYANWITLGGANRLSFNYGWGVVRMPHRIMLPQYWHSEPYSPVELKYETILNHLPLMDGDLESAGGVVQHYRDWLSHPDYDEYWRSISDEERLCQRQGAGLHQRWLVRHLRSGDDQRLCRDEEPRRIGEGAARIADDHRRVGARAEPEVWRRRFRTDQQPQPV